MSVVQHFWQSGLRGSACVLEILDTSSIPRVDAHDFFFQPLLRLVVCAAGSGSLGGRGRLVCGYDPWRDVGGWRVADGVGVDGGEKCVVEAYC